MKSNLRNGILMSSECAYFLLKSVDFSIALFGLVMGKQLLQNIPITKIFGSPLNLFQ